LAIQTAFYNYKATTKTFSGDKAKLF